MSGEGRLHKKIREFPMLYTPSSRDTCCEEIWKYQRWKEAFDKVLAEAKISFPQELLLMLRSIKHAEKHKVTYCMKFDEAMRLLDWFERWFGKAGAEAGKAQTKKD